MSEGARLYNFMWICGPASPTAAHYSVVRMSRLNPRAGSPGEIGELVLNRTEPSLQQVDAIILYPSLLTPGIVTSAPGGDIELLILAKSGLGQPVLKSIHVNNQLKVAKGLEKGFTRQELVIDYEARIKVSPKTVIGSNDPDIIETMDRNTQKGNFAGLIDRRALKYLREDKHYTDLYKVTVIDAVSLFTDIDSRRYTENGVTKKRYYYLDVTEGWLEKILKAHGIKDRQGHDFSDTAPAVDEAMYVVKSAPHLRNYEFIEDPVIFRSRDDAGTITSRPSVENTGSAVRRRSEIQARGEEKHIAEFDEAYRSAWRMGDRNVTQGGSGYWSNPHSRYLDRADRLVIYRGEKIFIPDENGAKDPHDDLIHERVKALLQTEWHGPKDDDDGLFAYNVDGAHGVDMTTRRYDLPLESWHPVFYFHTNTNAATNGYALNTGHITDLHLVSRQQALAKSDARVIECGLSSEDAVISPEVGRLVNNYSKNVKALLDAFGAAQDVDMVLVTGDLIDHMRNVYVKRFGGDIQTKDVWDIVDLGERQAVTYKPFIDNIAFYSLVVYFYRKYKKPVFVVSGNHDCYKDPYGISPRAGGERLRANEGIPADHNMTIYEAILAFGPTYHRIVDSSNFDTDNFKWFYTVLTPFSDFAVKLVRQALAGIAWGEDEEVISAPGYQGAQGIGHLPRAEETLSATQKKILDKAVEYAGGRKKIVMMSHFTIASFADAIPMDNNTRPPAHRDGAAKIEYGGGWDSSHYDYGTFEKRREYLYKEKLYNNPGATGKIHTVLTGHSHRRGLYGLTGLDTGAFTDDGVLVSFSEFRGTIPNPAIIVSDSGGPLPRYNRKGEFHGWGSWKAAGTKVKFINDGTVRSIEKVEVGPKPRIAVALDYVSVIFNQDAHANTLFGRLGELWDNMRANEETDTDVWKRFDADDEDFEFTIELNEWLSSNWRALSSWWVRPGDELTGGNLGRSIVDGIHVEKAYLYARTGAAWRKVKLLPSMDADSVANDQRANREFIRILNPPPQNQPPRCFMAIKFGCRPDCEVVQHYDFDSYWCFECTVATVTRGVVTRYVVDRNTIYRGTAELPDFPDDRRAANYGNKYP